MSDCYWLAAAAVESNIATVKFIVGDKFSSYQELQQKVKEFFVQLWRREARTIAAAEKRTSRYSFGIIVYQFLAAVFNI